ncbi:MAG: shikimate dehydrogenase, partial [Gammaproteobacteria bacterium]|nr:shikimate dehydrogenase [Gammaproteobacteria bacterium]
MSKSTDSGTRSLSTNGCNAARPEGACDLKLGLIGDNIAQSRAPCLHEMAGRLTNLTISYERLVPRELGTRFEEIFASCEANGFRGINVTYPYKELAASKVKINDPVVRAMGAVNTVLFERSGPIGFNTDYSGMIAAYRGVLGDRAAGRVCMIGAGGVGKAVAFAMLKLGLERLWIVDLDRRKAENLAARLKAVSPATPVSVADDAEAIAAHVDGLVNCTPVGMVGHEGTPLPREQMRSGQWAFDAVYTPIDTQFLTDAVAEGLIAISGYE